MRPTAYYYALADGVHSRAIAPKLESAFVANGLEADVLEDAVSISWTFNRLIQASWVSAGSSASTHWAYQRSGGRGATPGDRDPAGPRLPAKGDQLAFLVESSFIALTAIIVCSLLTLIVAAKVINDSASQSSWAEIAIVPWANLGIIFAAVCAAALLVTLGPAVRASRVDPAEALRYE